MVKQIDKNKRFELYAVIVDTTEDMENVGEEFENLLVRIMTTGQKYGIEVMREQAKTGNFVLYNIVNGKGYQVDNANSKDKIVLVEGIVGEAFTLTLNQIKELFNIKGEVKNNKVFKIETKDKGVKYGTLY